MLAKLVDFDSQLSYGAKLKEFPQEIVKNEPMFFNASIDYAMKNGGPITKDFLDNVCRELAGSFGLPIFDSRVHMLMKDWYPCIPGFHHDDVPRLRADKQPWYPEIDGPAPEGYYFAHHAMAMYGDDICRTEFAIGTDTFSSFLPGETAYKLWHPQVVSSLQEGTLTRVAAPMHQIIYFDARTWHQGTRSVGNGWRWFGRLSWNTGRKATNEVRRQVQVYLEFPMEGW